MSKEKATSEYEMYAFRCEAGLIFNHMECPYKNGPDSDTPAVIMFPTKEDAERFRADNDNCIFDFDKLVKVRVTVEEV